MLKIDRKPNLVEDFLDKYIDSVYNKLGKNINSGFKYNNNNISLSKMDKRFLKQEFSKDKIKGIIQADTDELKSTIKHLSIKKDLCNKSTKLYKAIYNAFVMNGYNKIDKFEFIKNIGLKSCPYCNRSYVYTINKNKNLKPEIDHFYPKALYPYLAISYYNLIPSCPVCNGFGAKGSKDSYKDKLKNPYDINYDDFQFTFEINSVDIENNSICEDSIEIKLKSKIDANNKYFQIENLYKEHRDIVLDLYHKTKKEYSPSFLELLNKDIDDLDLTKEDIYRFITCGYYNNDDLHKRPLSKLIKDISQELNLI